jgi:hypothetical protein
MPKVRAFLETYHKKHIPDQSTLRKRYLPMSYKESLENIRGNLGDAFIWVAVEETTNCVGRFITIPCGW